MIESKLTLYQFSFFEASSLSSMVCSSLILRFPVILRFYSREGIGMLSVVSSPRDAKYLVDFAD